MVVLNAATILSNVRERYARDKIYTRAARMLVALNPGHPPPELYTDATRRHSRDADLRDPRLEPHLYDVAEQAYRQLVMEGHNQSIVISGESGSGKTESIKYCMNYLVWRSDAATQGSGATAGGAVTSDLTQRIMQSNPLLEALGNAKTQRNHNSSRFGKYITLQFSSAQLIVGAQIHTFLLEKSRVTNATAPYERSYHVLYQLVCGSPLAKGAGVGDFRMISQSGTNAIPGVDDAAEFKKLQMALGWFGVESKVQEGLEVLLGALHLGNVAFDGSPDEPATITQEGEAALAQCEALLGMPQKLRANLIQKEMVAGGEKMTLQLKPLQAACATR